MSVSNYAVEYGLKAIANAIKAHGAHVESGLIKAARISKGLAR